MHIDIIDLKIINKTLIRYNQIIIINSNSIKFYKAYADILEIQCLNLHSLIPSKTFENNYVSNIINSVK